MLEQKIVLTLNEIFEIITEKEDFYKIKTELEKKIENFQLFFNRMETFKLYKFK